MSQQLVKQMTQQLIDLDDKALMHIFQAVKGHISVSGVRGALSHVLTHPEFDQCIAEMMHYYKNPTSCKEPWQVAFSKAYIEYLKTQ